MTDNDRQKELQETVLKYLDFLRPLLLHNNSLVKVALARFDFLQSKTHISSSPPLDLLTYEMSLREVYTFFPVKMDSFDKLVAMISVENKILGKRFLLIDILTILVIILRGSLEEKTSYLFKWYNTNGSGIMTEIEHTYLILKVSECLTRLKFLGTIDITEDDAKHIAFKSRAFINKENNGNQKISFLPGLTLEDFNNWARIGNEGKVVVKFVQVIDRLADNISVLNARTNSLANIIEEKNRFKSLNPQVPRLKLLNNLNMSTGPIHVISRGSDFVTLLLSIDCHDTGKSSEEFYIQYEKLNAVPYPLYPIPSLITENIDKTGSQDHHKALPKCCERLYTLISYQKNSSKRQQNGCSKLLQVHIDKLDPNARYNFTVYTESTTYVKVDAKTLNSKSNSGHNTSISILPGSMSISDAADFIKATPSVNSSECIVYSGTLCSIEEELDAFKLFTESQFQACFHESFGSIIASSVDVKYDQLLKLYCKHLFSITSGVTARKGSTVYHKEKQILYHNGMGPWGTPEFRSKVHEICINNCGLKGLREDGEKLFKHINHQLENMYKSAVQSLLPSYKSLRHGPFELYLMDNQDKLSQSGIIDIIASLNHKLGDTNTKNNAKDRLVLILRSPEDLFVNERQQKRKEIDKSIRKNNVKSKTALLDDNVSMPVLATIVDEPSVEQLHHHTPAPANNSEAEQIEDGGPDQAIVDTIDDEEYKLPEKNTEKGNKIDTEGKPCKELTELLEVMFSWISQCSDDRSIYLVSNGWHEGYNFEIMQSRIDSSGQEQKLRIVHENLLVAKGKPSFADADEDKSLYDGNIILQTIEKSLPFNCNLNIMQPSPLRALVLQNQLHKEDLESASSSTNTENLKSSISEEFLPFNKIELKAEFNSLNSVNDLAILRFIDGPRLARLQSNEVIVSGIAVGYGKLKCTLYELPFEIDYHDTVALCTTDRDNLRKLKSITKRCTKYRELFFPFEDLQPYNTYCVILDLLSSSKSEISSSSSSSSSSKVEAPIVVHFRTLHQAHGKNSSIILSSTSEPDYKLPSFTFKKIDELLSGIRPVAAPVHLLHVPDLAKTLVPGPDKPDKMDLAKVSRRACLVHLKNRAITGDDDSLLSYDSFYSLLNVSWNGRFCRISPHNDSTLCLKKMADLIWKIPVWHPEIDSITIFTHRPLIRHLQRRKKEGIKTVSDPDRKIGTKWSFGTNFTYPMDQYSEWSGKLFHALLQWKSQASCRDCQVITLARVKTPKLAIVGFHLKKRREQMIQEEKLAGAAQPFDLMSSSVAYSDNDYQSSVISVDDTLDSFSIQPSVSNENGKVIDHEEKTSPSLAGSNIEFAASVGGTFISLQVETRVTIRHLILPIWADESPSRVGEEEILFPPGLYKLYGIVDYEFDPNPDLAKYNISPLHPRKNLHPAIIDPIKNSELAVYLLDIFIPRERGEEIDFLQEDDPENQKQGEYHQLIPRDFISDIDMVDIITGPVVGEVSHENARIMLEINRDLRQLTIVLNPLGRNNCGGIPSQDPGNYESKYNDIESLKLINEEYEADIVIIQNDIRAHKVFSVLFENLAPNRVYGIFIPELHGRKRLGLFRTQPTFTRFSQIVIAGGNSLDGNPCTPNILSHIQSHQISDPRHILREMNYLFPSCIYSLYSEMDPFKIRRTNHYDNCSWEWVAEHAQKPCTDSVLTIHIGNQTILTHFLNEVIESLMDHGRHFTLPLFEANALSAYYFNQFEEAIKDKFRLIWNIPVIRDAMSTGSNIPLFISQYLVSYRSLPNSLKSTDDAADPNDIKLLAVIRKVFETHFQSYISPLYNHNIESSHHGKLLRTGPLVYILLDVVSGRKKLKKKKDTEDDGEAKTEQKKKKKAKPDLSFSSGFLDKAQWKLIKEVTEDDTVTQIVIISQKPFVHLYELPRAYEEPQSLEKGEMMEWSPTTMDLREFLGFFIKWLQPKEKMPALSKNIAIVSSYSVPFVTQIQDLTTGVKIHQMCVGNAGVSSTPSSSDSDIQNSVVMKGKLGKLRYTHNFEGLDYWTISSLRENVNTMSSDISKLTSPPKASYGVLDFCFDTWKAVGTWKIFQRSETILPVEDNNATLFVGPIIGPPFSYEIHDGVDEKNEPVKKTVFEVGVMIEIDRNSTVGFAVRNALYGTTEEFSFDIPGRIPFICKIGPLDINSRFNIQIISGIRGSLCRPFVIGTEYSFSNANVAFINCKMVQDSVPQADFTKDVLRRFKVPFNGITVTVHMNSYPEDINEKLDELKRLASFKKGMEYCGKVGHLTSDFYKLMSEVMEIIRDKFRRHFSRPSYQEALQGSYTLFMQTHNLFNILDEELVEENSDDEDEVSIDESKVPKDEYADVLRLLRLMTMRIFQEYCEQLNSPKTNVFKALLIKEDDGEIVDESQMDPEDVKRLLDLDRMRGLMMEELSMNDMDLVETELKRANPNANPIKLIFKQWFCSMQPAEPGWRNWVSPNGSVLIERAPAVLKKNLPKYLEMFKKKSTIEAGNRIIVIDGNTDGSGVDNAFTEGVRIGSKLHSQSKKWLYPHPLFPEGILIPADENDEDSVDVIKEIIKDDRRVCYVCPTHKYGTDCKKILEVKGEDDGLHGYIYTVDSMYRCNETERGMRMIEIEAESLKLSKEKSKNAPKASTKKAKEKAKEQEELKKKQKMKEMQDSMSNLVPDGYVIIECQTSLMQGRGQIEDKITNLAGRCIPSVAGGMGTSAELEIFKDVESTRPTPYDYILLPEWILKYFPSRDGVFAQDEVLLWMRQNKTTSRILRIFESDEIEAKFIELYEHSRLSELSRPIDLREVDMSLPGVTELFLKELIEKLWLDIIPEDAKPFLVPVNDDFMRSFILSRAIPDPSTQLASSELFAKAIQHALVLAVSMKISLSMQTVDRYSYIMEQPEPAQVAAQFLQEKDIQLELAKQKAQGTGNNAEVLELEERANEEDLGYESDLAELEREEKYLEEEELRLEELEEIKERMDELKDAEKDEIDELEEMLAGEEEEEEEIPGIMDDEVEEGGKKEEEEVPAKKSKSELEKEEAAKIQILTLKSIPTGVETVLDEVFKECADIYAKEIIFETDEKEKYGKLPQLSDVDRIADSKLQLSRLNKERKSSRRAFGPRIIHLS